MSALTVNDSDSDILRLVVEHVFMPPKLPQEDLGEQIEQKTNVALCNNLIEAARDFLPDVPFSQHSLWMHVIKMMEIVRRAAQVPFDESEMQRVFLNMEIGGMSM
jgi:uncharacterized protein DUF6606